jgi:hypothetical protein
VFTPQRTTIVLSKKRMSTAPPSSFEELVKEHKKHTNFLMLAAVKAELLESRKPVGAEDLEEKEDAPHSPIILSRSYSNTVFDPTHEEEETDKLAEIVELGTQTPSKRRTSVFQWMFSKPRVPSTTPQV